MRALVSPFLSVLLALAACGGGPSAQQEPAKAPVVEVGPGPEAPAVTAKGPEDDGEADPQAVNAVEATDVCIGRMREGVGLPGGQQARMKPDAEQYAKALAAERAGNLNDARKEYLKLIQQYPLSPYVPLVYFALGELFFQEGHKDPANLDFARLSYLEVVKYPRPDNTAWIAANFRLAEMYRLKGDHLRVLHSLDKVAGAIAKEPDAPCAASLAGPMRASLVAVYAETGRPAAAFEFFKKASGDQGDDRTNALAMVASLAELYVQQQKHDDAVTVLLSPDARFYDATYCRREGQLVTKLGSSLATTRHEELARAHALHCVAR